MLKILRTIMRAGVATTSYPALPEAPPTAYRGRPELRADACDGTGACVAVCPSSALTLGEAAADGAREWRLDLARCVFCGLCREACPNGAIVLTDHFELAARRREDLVSAAQPRGPAGARRNGRTGE